MSARCYVVVWMLSNSLWSLLTDFVHSIQHNTNTENVYVSGICSKSFVF